MAWVMRVRHEDSVALDVLAWTLVAIDTGGLHWFLLSIVYHWIRGHGKNSA